MRLACFLFPCLVAGASAAPLPFLQDGRPSEVAVFRRGEAVHFDAPEWRVKDINGSTISGGTSGIRLPTHWYGTFRVHTPGHDPVSYAVVPDIAPEPASPFAMGAYLGMRYAPEELVRAAETLRRIGVSASREELRWDIAEPEPGRWNWEGFDRAMVALHDHGIEALGLLDYWGAYVRDRPDRTEGLAAFSDEAVAAFARYCREAVRRYQPGGTLAQRQGWRDGWGVRHWEVWNEPATFWSGTPEQFGDLLKAASAAIKAEQPDAVVHFSNIGPEWDTRAISVAGRSFDGVTPHYYSPPRSPDAARMGEQMRDTVAWFSKRGVTNDFWVSEVGWETTKDLNQEARQAKYLVRAYAMALSAGMDRVFWYDFRNDGAEGDGGQIPWFGVVNRDFTPKASLAAFAAMRHRLAGMRPDGEAAMGAAVRGIVFEGPEGSTAVVWSDTEDGTVRRLPGETWRDTMGNRISDRQPVRIGGWPVYVTAKGMTGPWMRKRLQYAEIEGIPPVRVKPVQVAWRNGDAYLVMRVKNQSARPMGVRLWTEGGRTWVNLEPGETAVREVRHPMGRPSTLAYPRRVVRYRYRVQSGSYRDEQWVVANVADLSIPGNGDPSTNPYLRLDMKPKTHGVGLIPIRDEDLQANVSMAWDDSGLEMRLQTYDDVFHQPHTGPEIWQADSVQVAIEPGRGHKPHEFGFALTPDGPKAFRYGEGAWTGTFSAEKMVMPDTAGVFITYRIRFPWADLAPLRPEAGTRIRMNLMVNENDGHGRRGWLEWTPGIGTGLDPAQWMEWTLWKRAVPGGETKW